MTDHLQPSDSDTPADQWDAIARFLAGDASAGDSADVRQWFSAHPDDAAVVASLDRLLPPNASDASLARSLSGDMLPFGRPVDVESALRHVHARMETATTAPALTATSPAIVSRTPAAREGAAVRPDATRFAPRATNQGWTRTLWGMAAILVGAVGVVTWRARTSEQAPVAALTYSTPVGTSDSVMLSDGTRVLLAPGSRLTVAANYDHGQRDVELEGAGLFTVKHDAERPFTVRAGSAVIHDLGTVFSVKAIEGAGVTVSVTEGSVELSDSGAGRSHGSANLGAGDRGRLLPNGSVVSERGAVTPDETGWVTGRLVYRDAPLAEVQADLRRWYGVELVVGDSAWRALSITTDALASEPVSKLVDRLAASWGATSTRRGDTLFVDRPGVSPKH